jgi:hypothetical protein
MSKGLGQKELVKIIMSFMDEFVTRYTVLEDLKVNLGEHPISTHNLKGQSYYKLEILSGYFYLLTNKCPYEI